ncbi:hypothetical protein BE25_0156 [Staphylococcus phage vB_SepM_BE25]|nr:hypothetical protein BE24_0125 [Staphylococcus phage vB_SepM_BE24]WEU70642.1 hypothetical protein BE25_0156 [Staphylococcus phage vB_SepM_BE25]
METYIRANSNVFGTVKRLRIKRIRNQAPESVWKYGEGSTTRC